MGYTKIIQYGDLTEVYQYERNLRDYKSKALSIFAQGQNIRHATTKRKKAPSPIRSKRSVKRALHSFFRLCHHNNCCAVTIHFFTLTFAYDVKYKEAGRHVARFMERLRRIYNEKEVAYISVPELTEKGRYHFHLLVYNLPPETALVERKTRNLQRQFERGYLDICLAEYTSEGIAGYMAKYMAKAFDDFKNEAKRYYNCSRNIKKISSAGSNTLDQYLPLIVYGIPIHESSYAVPYMKTCHYKKFRT